MGKKTEVPQELMNQIIDCYVNQQLSLQKTLVKLKLPFSLKVLKRLLTEQGVHIRTYKEAASQGIRGPIPEIIAEQIINLYQRGYSVERIKRELSRFYSTDKIKKTLLENNIQLRTLEKNKKCKIDREERKYLINDYYCLESHNGAWILGMFAANGYLPAPKNGGRNRVVFSLPKKDEEVLYMIKKELGYEGSINTFLASDHIHEFASLSFTSKILRKKMEQYGIVNDKSFKIVSLPKLPDEFMLDYVRGYIDGDGYITKKGIYITSINKSFLEDIQKYLDSHYNIKSHIYSSHNVYKICLLGEESRKLGLMLYDNNYLALPRKKKRFFEIITPKSLNTPKE